MERLKERAYYRSLEEVSTQARRYPAQLLEGCETGLCLFAAAFLGHNDAVWMAMRGMRVWCVDLDGDRLRDMRSLYPAEWEFTQADAWQYAYALQRAGVVLDAVSVDNFTGDIEQPVLDSLPLWCSLARKVVTVTLTEHAEYVVPAGWRSSRSERAAGIYWLVLERDA